MENGGSALLEQKSDETPWTMRQTLLGVLFTLAPWITFALLSSNLNGKSVQKAPLPFQQDLASAVVLLLFSILVEGAFLLAPLFFARRAYRLSASRGRLIWQSLGFRGFSVVRALLWIVFFFILILLANQLYQSLLHYLLDTLHIELQTNDQYLLGLSKNAPLSTYATLLAAVFVAPFCEEIFFRGFVFPGLLRGMPLGWAIVVSALLFALAHADPGSFAVLFIIGLALAFLRWRTRSIWPAIALHMLNNATGALMIFLLMQGR